MSKIAALKAPEFIALGDKIRRGHEHLDVNISLSIFIDRFHSWISSSTSNGLGILDHMPHREACIGVTHQIDSLIMKYGEHGLQILEHDYAYYRRLWPYKEWAVPGNLIENKPLIIACPFPGYGDVHAEWGNICDECEQKNIEVHLDCAWLTSAKGIRLDLDRQCIRSVTISLSKGLCLDWNRIGVRYSRSKDITDPITIANFHDMINKIDMAIAIRYMDEFDADHLWRSWGNAYMEFCRINRLRPTACIHVAQELGNRRPVGTQGLLDL